MTRRSAIALLAIWLVACQAAAPQAKAPSGAAGDMARQVAAIAAPNAEVVDQPFEDLLASLDLNAKFGARSAEIADQIRKTRGAVAAARASSSVSSGFRLTRVAEAVGTFSVPLFATQLATSLDPLTKRSQTITTPGRPYANTENGENSFTTTTLSIAETYTGAGSRVTGTVRWSYSTITIETKTGATLVHLTDDRELVGEIDVCPDAAGAVPATLKVTSAIVADIAGVTTTRKSTGNSSFEGKVDDRASLLSVAQQQKVEASSQSTAGSGGYSSSTAATWNASGAGFLGGFDVGSFTGSITPNGATSAADAAKAAGWDTALDAYALEPSYTKAQDLWRHGRCVVVVASDYSAETPIEVADQNKSQHDEQVDVASETKFNATLRQRFSGSVTAAINASLNGEKALEPNKLESAGALTYKAPAEDGKKATATLQSTSKRGIGTLLLDFHTGGALTLTITGTLTGDQPFNGGFGNNSVRDKVTMGPFTFQKGPLDAFVAMGTWASDTHQEFGYGPVLMVCDGHETGPAQLVARMETRGASKVWVIDPRNSVAATGIGTMDCTTTSPQGSSKSPGAPSDGSSAGFFLRALGEIVIPQEGGSVAVHGTSNAGGQWQAQGTASATTKK